LLFGDHPQLGGNPSQDACADGLANCLFRLEVLVDISGQQPYRLRGIANRRFVVAMMAEMYVRRLEELLTH
jgi:hypothetical protein